MDGSRGVGATDLRRQAQNMPGADCLNAPHQGHLMALCTCCPPPNPRAAILPSCWHHLRANPSPEMKPKRALRRERRRVGDARRMTVQDGDAAMADAQPFGIPAPNKPVACSPRATLTSPPHGQHDIALSKTLLHKRKVATEVSPTQRTADNPPSPCSLAQTSEPQSPAD